MQLAFRGSGFRSADGEVHETVHRAPRYRAERLGQPRDYCEYTPRPAACVCIEHELELYDDGERRLCPRGHECKPGAWLVVRLRRDGRRGVCWSPDGDEGHLA